MKTENGNGKNKDNFAAKTIRKNRYKIMEERHKERPDKKYKETRRIK